LKLLNYNKVLCLSPHPDDVEYGMLGSIAKFKDTSFDVVTLSAGGEFDKNGGFASEDRHVECENIWKSLKNLNFFTSQKDKSYFKDNSIEIFHSNYQCSKNGLTYVEKFKIIKAFN
jgi:uncharacterized protein YneR